MERSNNTVAVGAAMQWEVAAVLEALRANAEVHPCGRGIWTATLEHVTVLVYKTGVGMRSARRKTRDLLRDADPELVVNTGCAGALEDGWAAGDLAVATEIVSLPPQSHRREIDCPIRQVICEIADSQLPGRARAARVLTTRLPLLSEAEKRARAIESHAQLVEMEGVGVSLATEQRLCTFVSARVVLDPVGATLPDLSPLSRPGRSRAIGVAKLMLSPVDVYRAAATMRNGWLARKSLIGFWRALFGAMHAGTIDRDLSGLRY